MPPSVRRIARIFRRYAERQRAPGVAYGVIEHGALVSAACFGARDVERAAPVETGTVFRIASMTKSFTALAIMQLRDAGALSLEHTAAAYVPQMEHLRYPTVDSAPITIRQLLSMSAGLPQDDPWADRQLYLTDAELDALFARGASFSNPPGLKFEYSNYAYMLLGRIISRASGVPALDYITRHILQPLGMTSTVWDARAVAVGRLARGYRWEDDRHKPEIPLPSGGEVAAFAGLFTSVPDLARWVGLFQSAWPARDDPDHGILRRSSLREMQQIWQPREPASVSVELGRARPPSLGGYGCGLSVAHNGRWATVGHGGGVPGFGSHMRWAPAHGIGVVALANVTYANMHDAVSEALDALLEALPARTPAVKIGADLAEAHAGVLALLADWDDALAERLFADNFFLDLDRAHWRSRLDQLHRTHGRLRPSGTMRAENRLRGRWTMKGRRGWCEFFVTLSAAVPPRIQHLAVDSMLPPLPAMRKAAAALAALVTRPSRAGLRRIISAAADAPALWSRVSVAHALMGACIPGTVIRSDGSARATFQFKAGAETCEVDLTIDPGSGRLADVLFTRTGA